MSERVERWAADLEAQLWCSKDQDESITRLAPVVALVAAVEEQHLGNCMTVHFPGGRGCEICTALRAVLEPTT